MLDLSYQHTASLSYVHEFATSIRHRGSFVADRCGFAHDRDSSARELRIPDNFATVRSL